MKFHTRNFGPTTWTGLLKERPDGSAKCYPALNQVRVTPSTPRTGRRSKVRGGLQPLESWYGAQAVFHLICENERRDRLVVLLGNNFDEERFAQLAEVAHIVDGLNPELVDADGLRHRDLDPVIVVRLDAVRPDDVPVGRDDADESVEW